MAGRGFRRVGPESGAAWWAAVRSARRLRRVVDAVQLRGQVTAVSLLPEAVWWVDAATVTGDRLVDLTGSGRDLLFGPPGGEPVTLPHDGLTYLHIPTAGQGVQIAAPAGTAWMATRLDGSIVAGVTDADPWLFDVPGDWQQIASDDG